MSYFVFNPKDGGGCYIQRMDKQAIEAALAPGGDFSGQPILGTMPDWDRVVEGIVIIKGDLIIPEARTTVTKVPPSMSEQTEDAKPHSPHAVRNQIFASSGDIIVLVGGVRRDWDLKDIAWSDSWVELKTYLPAVDSAAFLDPFRVASEICLTVTVGMAAQILCRRFAVDEREPERYEAHEGNQPVLVVFKYWSPGCRAGRRVL